MAPRSPTMAFEPTPALEQDKENYSPFGYPNDIKPRDENRNNSVRFAEFPTVTSPIKRSQSLANPQNIPLLEPISSASNIIPRQQASSIRFKNPVPEIDMDAYIENTRSVIESQREGFEKEKKAFDRERKMWTAERSMLKARIAELESKLNKAQTGGSKRRYSNESTVAPGLSFPSKHSSFSGPSLTNSASSSRQLSQEKDKIMTPVWEGPEITAPVTRVFSNEDQKAITHLPSISEDEATSGEDDAISPKAEVPTVPIPIETIDSDLEGIMLKPTALAPSFVARINSGTQSPMHSPSPRPRPADGLAVEMKNLLSPLDEKLKRDAGHTPMNFNTNGVSTGGNSTEAPTPKSEQPPAPAATARPPLRPSENSDSYFSFSTEEKEDAKEEQAEPTKETRRAGGRRGTLANPGPILCEEPEELDEDPALQGPLMLDPGAKLKSSNSFLDLVDAKLQEEINLHPEVSSNSSQTAALVSPNGKSSRSPVRANDYERKQERIEADDGMPKLRMKRSSNFGSAWGGSFPGRHMSQS